MARQRGELFGITPTPVRMPPEMREWCEARAAENGIPLNGQLLLMLEVAREKLRRKNGDNLQVG
jgi:hypothetical protein